MGDKTMTAHKLTKRRIEDAKPATSDKTGLPVETILADGNTLYLRVRRAGSKQFVQIVRIDGKRYERSLGGWPKMGLAEARDIAHHAATQGDHGGGAAVAGRDQLVDDGGNGVQRLGGFAFLQGEGVGGQVRRQALQEGGEVVGGDGRVRDDERLALNVGRQQPGAAQEAGAEPNRIGAFAQIDDEFVDVLHGLSVASRATMLSEITRAEPAATDTSMCAVCR